MRGCGESLLRRWALKGLVDVALIQEHFKSDDSPLFNLFGPDWWNISSGAIGKKKGRKSGGCAIYIQPCLSSAEGFQHPGGRVCGLFTSGGLLINSYFPTRHRQPVEAYNLHFKEFVLDLTKYIEKVLLEHPISWIVCGDDLKAHFIGTGIPPRRSDDYAAKQIRSFMRRFKLISMASGLCPNRYTYLNSRGGVSCIDIF